MHLQLASNGPPAARPQRHAVGSPFACACRKLHVRVPVPPCGPSTSSNTQLCHAVCTARFVGAAPARLQTLKHTRARCSRETQPHRRSHSPPRTSLVGAGTHDVVQEVAAADLHHALRSGGDRGETPPARKLRVGQAADGQRHDAAQEQHANQLGGQLHAGARPGQSSGRAGSAHGATGNSTGWRSRHSCTVYSPRIRPPFPLIRWWVVRPAHDVRQAQRAGANGAPETGSVASPRAPACPGQRRAGCGGAGFRTR